MSSLRDQLVQLGVQLMEGTEVLNWQTRGERVVALETTSGRIAADQYVLATGAEASILSRMLGSKIPIVPGKGYSMEFVLPGQPVTTPMIFEDSHVAVTPYADRLRVGSTMQLTGYDRRVDRSRLKMIRNEAQTYLQNRLPENSVNDWAGWRPMMADDLPGIDQAASLDNAWIAAGNGMIGLSTGPATAQMIAQRICGEETDIPHQPFSLSRFSLSRFSLRGVSWRGHRATKPPKRLATPRGDVHYDSTNDHPSAPKLN
jgi:D-amino-acid dehydrogenase